MKKKINNHLAEGEATGHYHEATGNDVKVFEDAYGDESLHLVVTQRSVITHQEHNHIKIPSGEYRTGIVIEYDHALEEAKEVKD